MSGHNKWSKIKRQKGAEDAAKSKLFGKLVRAITVEAKKAGASTLGKGAPLSAGLETAIKKAREANVPNDTIERAVKKSAESAQMEMATYEAYGPGGTAILAEVMTDNKNRTVGEIRKVFSRHGGNMGEAGCVAFLFEKKGHIEVDAAKVDEDKLSDVLQQLVNLSPRGIRTHLGLNKPIYARTAAYGHFGRDPEADGGFSWEKTDLVAALKGAF